MKIVYSAKNGEIISAISSDQNPLSFYRYDSEEFKQNLKYIEVEEVPEPLGHFYIKDEGILKHNNEEIFEISKYGRILSSEDRLLNQLKPSREEIQKAENTIEILELLSEVL